jgi:hypothetical protein
MILGIKLVEWLTIIAIIVGPLLAFEAQRIRDDRRERRRRKLEIFRKLIMTLKVPLAPSHVDALNSIHVEFYDDGKVLEAWRLYASHLNHRQLPGEDIQRWAERKFDLLVELTFLMGQSLGYPGIDRAALRDNTYVPQGYGDVEAELQQIRKAWLEVLGGLRPVPATLVGPVQVETPIQLLPELAPRPAAAPHAVAAEALPDADNGLQL